MLSFDVEKFQPVSVVFPSYRKYKNNASYFKIYSLERFDEIRVIGDKYYLHVFEAKILPDRNLVQDLLYSFKENCDEISEPEYDAALARTGAG